MTRRTPRSASPFPVFPSYSPVVSPPSRRRPRHRLRRVRRVARVEVPPRRGEVSADGFETSSRRVGRFASDFATRRSPSGANGVFVAHVVNARAARSIAGNPPPSIPPRRTASPVRGVASSSRRYASVSARDGSSRGARRVPLQGTTPDAFSERARRRPRRALDASRDPPGTSTRRDGRRPGCRGDVLALGVSVSTEVFEELTHSTPAGRCRAHSRMYSPSAASDGRDRAGGTPPRDETTRPGSRARRRGPHGAQRRVVETPLARVRFPEEGVAGRGASRLSPRRPSSASSRILDVRSETRAPRWTGVVGLTRRRRRRGAAPRSAVSRPRGRGRRRWRRLRANAGGDSCPGSACGRPLPPMSMPSRTRRCRRGDGGRERLAAADVRLGPVWRAETHASAASRASAGRPARRSAARDCCAPRRVARRRRSPSSSSEGRAGVAGDARRFAARAKHEAASRASPDRNAAAPAALAAVHVSCADGASGGGGGGSAGVVSERSIAVLGQREARAGSPLQRAERGFVRDGCSEKWSAREKALHVSTLPAVLIAASRASSGAARGRRERVTPPGRRFDSPNKRAELPRKMRPTSSSQNFGARPAPRRRAR